MVDGLVGFSFGAIDHGDSRAEGFHRVPGYVGGRAEGFHRVPGYVDGRAGGFYKTADDVGQVSGEFLKTLDDVDGPAGFFRGTFDYVEGGLGRSGNGFIGKNGAWIASAFQELGGNQVLVKFSGVGSVRVSSQADSARLEFWI